MSTTPNLLSIITPTHNPKYIGELWESIKKQTYKDWEWVIVTNNGAKVDIQDERVRVIECPFKSKSVGALKNYAFSQGRGDILVEVDHDDLLTPDCLEEISRAFEDEEIGFVYSNNAKLSKDFVPYNPEFGWDYKKYKEHIEMVSFEPSAASLAYVWFAPDHVRAWRKTVYQELGGHNSDLDVLDDHELLIRTYLKTKFKWIDKCLYLYRITGDNTWLERNAKIQSGTVELCNQYLYQLAERDAELKGLEKIDLGGGFDCPKGYKSVDLKNADIIADLNESIPLPDNSVGVIRAWDILEHLKDKQKIMSEIHRVLADGGWLLVGVPSTDGRGAFQDPTHVSYWNENSFWYWTRKEQAKYIYNDKVRFQVFRNDTVFPNEWCKEHDIPYVIANLRAIKSKARRPNLITI
jgi:glycosyltransferase involved in cell wall biosynthesis